MKKLLNTDFLNDLNKEVIRTCPICNEEKYHYWTDDHSIDFTTSCSCDIEREKRERAILLGKQVINKNILIKENKKNCGFSKRDIEDVNANFKTNSGNIETYNTLIKYANDFNENTSLGFYIYGSTGVGKSLMSKKAMKIILNRGYSAYITNIAELMKNIKDDLSNNSNNMRSKCQEIDLLVIDDLGIEKPSEFDKQELFNIIDGRYTNKKPIIYTSNLPLLSIKNKYDNYERIYSRIIGTCKVIKMTGADKRKF